MKEYVFITTEQATVPRAGPVRRTIRRQAMKGVAVGRGYSTDHGKADSIYSPVYMRGSLVAGLSPEAVSTAAFIRAEDDENGLSQQTPSLTIHALDLSNVHQMTVLSALTTPHVNHMTLQYLPFLQSNLYFVYSHVHEPWSYVLHLPNLYGSCAYLDLAIDCLSAKVRQMFSGQYSLPSESRRMYAKALLGLHGALSDKGQHSSAEALCACGLLFLWEFLETPSCNGLWSHLSGMAQLIQIRNPDRFQTEFEKAMFVAYAGAIVVRSLFENTSCFLEDNQWQNVFRSAILKDSLYSDRSEIGITLFMAMSHIPGFLNTCTDVIIQSQGNPDISILEVSSRISAHRIGLVQWFQRWKHILQPSTPPVPTTGNEDILSNHKRLEILGSYMSYVILDNRLLTSLGKDQSSLLERQTLTLAQDIMSLHHLLQTSSPQGGLFLSCSLKIAQAAVSSSQDWMRCEGVDHGAFVTKTTFLRWNELMGRRL